MVKVGQRWARINYDVKYIVEVIILPDNLGYTRCKYVQSDDTVHFQIGKITTIHLPKNSYSDEYWKYLEGQDKPNE